jgi:methionyl-tRNA formyltransferase
MNNILYVSSTRLGLHCFESIQQLEDVRVVGILTAPPRFTISYAPEGVQNVLHVDFRPASEKAGCELITLSEKMSSPELFEKVARLNPDCLIVAGWHHMIPKKWLDNWPTFGLHASLLPRFAGGAPLVWALIEGEKRVGVSLFKFDEGVDTGPVVGQRTTRVKRRDDIGSILDRIQNLSADLLAEELPTLADKARKFRNQDLSQRTVYAQRKPSDGEIPSGLNGRQLVNFVRAQTRPYPGAFINLDGSKLTIWKIVRRRPLLRRSNLKVLCRRDRYFISCGRWLFGVTESSWSD